MDGWMMSDGWIVGYMDVRLSLINIPVCINLICNCLRSLPRKQNGW